MSTTETRERPSTTAPADAAGNSAVTTDGLRQARDHHTAELAGIDAAIADETQRARANVVAELAGISGDAEAIAEELRQAREQVWTIAEALTERLRDHERSHEQVIQRVRQFNATHAASDAVPLGSNLDVADVVCGALPMELRRLYNAARRATRGAALELAHAAITTHP
ncbi:hypothetical protein AB0E08_10915 [Streptomyces sp. NPDC048281]|uniref:hypothetical protein n=1 Tax=Streptomyces sp. NPDC048281 TaxID=3154715 RepID=UPI00342C0A51